MLAIERWVLRECQASLIVLLLCTSLSCKDGSKAGAGGQKSTANTYGIKGDGSQLSREPGDKPDAAMYGAGFSKQGKKGEVYYTSISITPNGKHLSVVDLASARITIINLKREKIIYEKEACSARCKLGNDLSWICVRNTHEAPKWGEVSVISGNRRAVDVVDTYAPRTCNHCNIVALDSNGEGDIVYLRSDGRLIAVSRTSTKRERREIVLIESERLERQRPYGFFEPVFLRMIGEVNVFVLDGWEGLLKINLRTSRISRTSLGCKHIIAGTMRSDGTYIYLCDGYYVKRNIKNKETKKKYKYAIRSKGNEKLVDFAFCKHSDCLVTLTNRGGVYYWSPTKTRSWTLDKVDDKHAVHYEDIEFIGDKEFVVLTNHHLDKYTISAKGIKREPLLD